MSSPSPTSTPMWLRQSQQAKEGKALVVVAFTSGELAAWGVPFLELARMGRTDVWVSAAPSFKSCPHPCQRRVGRLLRALAQHGGLARLTCRVRLSKERARERNSPQPSSLCMESPLFA